ncbi:mannose-6-phosphate isomerase, class I [Streptomyces alkaliterrae]|uniref:mannose-6-phosphate isomerase n=1 Tax=Streptomyces alkaliterrae TaxID=2213162 RepID=A0A5P0YV55_9ACTN|nr:mannose-6-phosphate isomerase, class I [Streptomyces alkaliterrae]MBB1255015.1 mannose-6-phosphate isomerase, class I [Streptomyces alkaliterrae]MBB1261323.1 mannose-6-phosphate isomerase, class I [Streptomyces alkaliterrae]MQS04178.1 mannose-6-phosphate isomerase, class I [Streptomyces alkaliterrae]
MDRLVNTVRPYSWGSTTAIPELLGQAPTGEPQAEMWMGAHPGAPSRIDRGQGPTPLNEIVAADPEGELGAECVAAFGPELPFLFKVLAAAAPLSLQVHPDLGQAREGYADEERRGIPRNAPNRNYKDGNHKPELICALGPFEGLCGFRPADESAELIAALDVDELKPYADLLHAHPEDAALREMLTAVLGADRAELADGLAHAVAAAERLGAEDGPHAAAYAACAAAAHHFPGDPGFLAALLLNHVRLNPGEAMYLGAGVPHAYLSGLGVELMANSDNVLRCGFTPKHVDVPELLRVVRFEPGDPAVLRPEPDEPDVEEVYSTPVSEFRLSRYALAPGSVPARPTGGRPQILLCTAGGLRLREAGGEELALERGQSVYLNATDNVEISGEGTVFRATVSL